MMEMSTRHPNNSPLLLIQPKDSLTHKYLDAMTIFEEFISNARFRRTLVPSADRPLSASRPQYPVLVRDKCVVR